MLRFVTSNKHKFAEFRTIASGFHVELEMVEASYPEIQSFDLEEIARRSAEECAKDLGQGFFVEDAGLFVDALGGFPGPYSSYVQSTIGNAGILALMRGRTDRSAHFLSVICHYDGRFHIYRGEVEGTICRKPRGAGGFGYDPIFIPRGERRTFAQMGPAKNEVSHRRRSSEIFFRTLAQNSVG